MLKNLFLLLSLTRVLSYATLEGGDTPVYFPLPERQGRLNFSALLDGSGKPAAVSVNGQSSYQAAQQFFYINGLQHWKLQTENKMSNLAGNDYLITPGIGAHKLHVRKVSWNRARKTCIQEGGHMVIINSNSEEKLLVRMLEENKLDRAWLGIHDLYEEGDWVTLMDEAIESAGYSKWKMPTQPDNYGGKQHCGVLLKDGGLDDLECTAVNAFFCKIPV
ncbi:hypothetical protein KM043_011463 [Ampulex compressa]|nr:hypothetical protein KM043_011463 [Ampulex compressa]